MSHSARSTRFVRSRSTGLFSNIHDSLRTLFARPMSQRASALTPPPPFTRRIRLEPLEDRRMLSTLFVDADATPGGDGLSWATAFDDLQAGLEAAEVANGDGDAGNDVRAIWIAEGVYRPSKELEAGDPRSASFSLVDGVTVYGGFAGTETNVAERDLGANHETVLSGDLGVVDDATDNAYTVVYCGEGVETGADGVSVVGGNADGGYDSEHPEKKDGGGVYSLGTLTLTNCRILGNSAWNGGGICGSNEVTITNCVLVGNSAGYGGGMSGIGTSTLVVTNSTIAGNSAIHGGGYYGVGTFIPKNSIFWANTGIDLGSRAEIWTSRTLIGIDPRFVRDPNPGPDQTWGTEDDDYGDVHLTSRSPALDYGLGKLLPADVGDLDGDEDTDEPLPLDRDGNLRIHGEAVDCGAFEFQGEMADGRENPALEVTTSVDVFDLYDDRVSLREAIWWANPDTGNATITFSAAVNASTITLQGHSLNVDKPITVDASMLDSLVIDAAGGSGGLTIITPHEEVTLKGLTITGGSAYCGGGVRKLPFGNLVLLDCSLERNSASYGAGVFSVGPGSLSVADSIVADNRSDVTGGGIYSYQLGTLTISDSKFQTNWAKGGYNCGGGAVFSDVETTVTGCSFAGNSSVSGGAIDLHESGMLTVAGSTFSENSGQNGGAIYSDYNSAVTVTDSIFVGNHTTESGGAIHGIGALTVRNSTFSENSANSGGAIRAGSLTMTDSTVVGNTASRSGGGLAILGTTTIANCDLSQNRAMGTQANDGFGGAIYNFSGRLMLTNSTLSANSANLGGAVWNDATATVVDSTITGNMAIRFGGGIFNSGYGLLTVTNSTVSTNLADSGGGIHCANLGCRATLNNAIVVGNLDISGLGPDVYRQFGTLSGSHNLIGDGSGQTALVNGENGNLVGTPETPIDPLFIRPPSDGGDGWGDNPDTPDIDESLNDDYGDLRLRPDSPAVDAGNNDLLPADEFDVDGDGDITEPIPFDLAGNARVENGTVDMGAYEYFAPVFVPGDLNGDEVVNSGDLDIVRANWGAAVAAGSLLDGDPSGDGVVNSDDLNIVRANWGSTAPAPAAAAVDVVLGRRASEAGESQGPRMGSKTLYGPSRREAVEECVAGTVRREYRDIWAAAMEAWERENERMKDEG